MSAAPATVKKRAPSLRGQLATGALMCIAALVVAAFMHPSPWPAAGRSGIAWRYQALVAVVFLLGAAACAWVVLAVPRLRSKLPIEGALGGFDLSGPRPLIIALAAGVGEELLFRAVLQTLLGLWLAAVVFALAHARTATLTDSRRGRFVYLVNVFVVGVGLGLVFEYIGLLAVIALHTAIDLAALLCLRHLQSRRHVVAAT